ncbi:hypothetical protein BDV32DRAFT_133171 [Aspergillus pseudonomiae]|nr:hypothetical protein BDV32DRAFT_133171 [Aspergillus pseudonomiae]
MARNYLLFPWIQPMARILFCLLYVCMYGIHTALTMHPIIRYRMYCAVYIVLCRTPVCKWCAIRKLPESVELYNCSTGGLGKGCCNSYWFPIILIPVDMTI